MKKTFITPSASILATEVVEMIATSTFGGDKIDNTGTNGGTGGGKVINARSNNAAGTTQPKVNANISAYELN